MSKKEESHYEQTGANEDGLDFDVQVHGKADAEGVADFEDLSGQSRPLLRDDADSVLHVERPYLQNQSKRWKNCSARIIFAQSIAYLKVDFASAIQADRAFYVQRRISMSILNCVGRPPGIPILYNGSNFLPVSAHREFLPEREKENLPNADDATREERARAHECNKYKS